MNKKRDSLERAALDLVQRGGFKGLSFRTLADEVGIKSSSVHYHFPEKTDLAKTLIERYSEEFFRLLNDISSQRWSLRKKLKAFISIFEDVAKNDKFCLCGMMAAEVEQLDPENQILLNDYFNNIELWLCKLFDQYEDDLETSISHRALARSLLSGVEGALLLDRVAGNTKNLKAQRDLFMSIAQ